jgi:cyclopropane fatty-acyl-phospholipid synthase-like methyltransferase
MSEDAVSAHYTHGTLLAALEAALAKIGKTPETVTVDDLAPADEFHTGGRQASEAFLDQLGLSKTDHLLDVGCGLGGTSRFAASRYGARVTGIDLTGEFVETGKALCRWVGLADRVALHQGSALAMPFESEAFDGGYMMHVGMNIADKAGLFREVHRVLRPGAVFGVYDVMRFKDGALSFPVPWAETAATSAVAPPAAYRRALEDAGFAIEGERNRRDYALAFFEEMTARAKAAGGPPPLGIHVLMGPSTPGKIGNVIENIASGRVAPVEIIARKAS